MAECLLDIDGKRYTYLILKCWSKLQLFPAIAIDFNSPLCGESERKQWFLHFIRAMSPILQTTTMQEICDPH